MHYKKCTLIVAVEHSSHGHEEGNVLTLGEGDTGQLGLGPDVMERTKPAKVNLPENVIQICAGGMHTACLSVNGSVSCTLLFREIKRQL